MAVIKQSNKDLMDYATQKQTQYANGVIYLQGGTAIPASPSNALTGTTLAIVTLNGAAWTAGSPANGLNFDTPVIVGNEVFLNKPSGAVWKYTSLAAGTVQWARFVANPVDAGAASNTHNRMDLTVSLLGGTGILQISKITFAAAGETGEVGSGSLRFFNPTTVA